jgi:hypothetical protein
MQLGFHLANKFEGRGWQAPHIIGNSFRRDRCLCSLLWQNDGGHPRFFSAPASSVPNNFSENVRRRSAEVAANF